MASQRPDGSLRRRLLSARIAQRHALWINHAHQPSDPAYHPYNPSHLQSNPAHHYSNPPYLQSNPAHHTSNPAHHTSNPAYLQSNPAHHTSNPAYLQSNPAHHTSSPAYLQSNPAHHTSNPAYLQSNPAHHTSNPAYLQSNPAHHTSSPAYLQSNPAPHTSNPAYLQSNPAHHTSNPAPHSSNPTPQTHLAKEVRPTWLLQPRPFLATPPPPHRSAYSGLSQLRRTGVRPLGCSRPSLPTHRHAPFALKGLRRRSHAKGITQATPLLKREEDSWSVHYSSHKSQRSHFLLPGSKPFISVDDVLTQGQRFPYGSCQIRLQNPASQTGSNQSQSRKKNRLRRKERMRQHAQAVPVAIVPINITGESFERQATSRRGGAADPQPHQLK
ncbi:hypothetical protein NHX12_034347, partial [Muraenolepis orangiensis]